MLTDVKWPVILRCIGLNVQYGTFILIRIPFAIYYEFKAFTVQFNFTGYGFTGVLFMAQSTIDLNVVVDI